MQVARFRFSHFITTRVFHLMILALGSAFLLAGAFHGNVWFDETYSVAIASHSFADIWSIGSSDVHPVLFYWALHILNLIFGTNIVVYRIFAILGSIALAVLGYTHLRRDFGWKQGILFSFFALFIPYVAVMAPEIRMYSWATFTVMVCAIYAYRIFGVLRRRAAAKKPGTEACDNELRDARISEPQPVAIPHHWWLIFFVASLTSAYLHYFGVLSAFVINLFFLIYLISHFRACKRELLIYVVGAIVLVALYAPWLVALAAQVGVVSNTYWANIVFPTTYIELATYPILTAPVSFAERGMYGVVVQGALNILLPLLLLLILVALVCALWKGLKAGSKSGFRPPLSRAKTCLDGNETLAALLGLAVYLGVFGIALAASFLMDSLILYYRYLFIAIGPLLLCVALFLSRINSRVIVGGICAITLIISGINQALLVSDNYSPENKAPLTYFEKVAQVTAENRRATTEDPLLILSSDIGIEGVTAVTYPEIPQTYLDWQKGNWGAAYQSYAPTLTSVKSWELALTTYEGQFVVLGQSNTAALPRDITDLSAKKGVTLLSSQTFYRPYERTYFTVAVMSKEGAW